MEQLKRFEADPEHYNPAGSPHEAPIYLDALLTAEFLTYSRDVDKNSPTWVKKQQGYLAWWADQIKDWELRVEEGVQVSPGHEDGHAHAPGFARSRDPQDEVLTRAFTALNFHHGGPHGSERDTAVCAIRGFREQPLCPAQLGPHDEGLECPLGEQLQILRLRGDGACVGQRNPWGRYHAGLRPAVIGSHNEQ